jgi:hypothetical protein
MMGLLVHDRRDAMAVGGEDGVCRGKRIKQESILCFTLSVKVRLALSPA